MNEVEFKRLVKKDKYQVFLFSSPIPIPLNFIVHTWFVLNKKGKLSRWEVWEHKNKCKTSWGHVHLNLHKPEIGIRMLPFSNFKPYGPRFNSKLIGKIEGKNAKKMIDFIEKNSKDSVFVNNYNYFGPNSNTYTQWIIDKFEKSKLKLPLSALGKNYKLK